LQKNFPVKKDFVVLQGKIEKLRLGHGATGPGWGSAIWGIDNDERDPHFTLWNGISSCGTPRPRAVIGAT